MGQTREVVFICEICGESNRELPLGGLTDVMSMTFPIGTCPSCGPIDWEVMQICRETVVGSNLN